MISDLSSFSPAVPDLVITAGRVLDPERGLDVLADVSVRAGRIVAVGRDLAQGVPRDRVIDGTGLLVTPGLIDLHTHVVPGLGDRGVLPDRAGVDVGVPVVVDAGTSGTAAIGLVRAWLQASPPRTKVLAFLDPGVLHVATHDDLDHRLGIAHDPRNLDLDGAARVLDRYGDLVVGLSVRTAPAGDPQGSALLADLRAVAGDRPVMVRPEGPAPEPALLEALRGGDLLAHALRSPAGLLDPAGAPLPELVDALARGARLSAVAGRFAEARRLLDAGCAPDTLASGLDRVTAAQPGRSLPELMTAWWALGLDLGMVVAMATAHAARAIGRYHELGTLEPGRPAEISLLSIEDGPAVLGDGHETITAERRLVPVGCVRAGVWVEAAAPAAEGQAA